MEIKQASLYDLVDVLFLLKQCVIEMNENGLKQWNSANPSPESIREDIEKGTLYFVKERGAARGMMKLTDETPNDYKNINWNGKSDKVLYIRNFAVHPLWRDTDLSGLLISFAETFARDNNYSEIRLDVLDSYPVEEKFYEINRFKLAGTYHSDFQKLPYTCYEKSL